MVDVGLYLTDESEVGDVLFVPHQGNAQVGEVVFQVGDLTLLVQSLHREGIFVVGAAGGATKTAQVRDNDADIAVDYSDPAWPERLASAPRISVVMDGVGGRIGRQALELLAPGGRIILYGWASGSPTEIATTDLISRQITATWALGPRMVPPGGWDALRSTSLARAAGGEFRPLITRFPLSEAAAAHAAVEDRTARGKVVLTSRAQVVRSVPDRRSAGAQSPSNR